MEKPKITIRPIAAPAGLSVEETAAVAKALIASVEKVIVGKREQVELAVAVLFAEGHLLIEDVPGVAKTMLARALAQSAGCSFKRIQCTPDLLPADVLGEPYVDRESGRTEFRFGPIFSQIVLVDEINRASPRTQAAMLEAMGEGSITEGRVSYQLERPFMIIATQNPIEHEGTFLLPEAQKDRFLVRMSLGYPSLDDEREMCLRFRQRHPIESLKPVTTPDRITKCQEAVREAPLDPAVCDYILAIVRATRSHSALLLGGSPRASLGLFRAAQAMAIVQGKGIVEIESVKALARHVLVHRLMVRSDEGGGASSVQAVVEEILSASRQ